MYSDQVSGVPLQATMFFNISSQAVDKQPFFVDFIGQYLVFLLDKLPHHFKEYFNKHWLKVNNAWAACFMGNVVIVT